MEQDQDVGVGIVEREEVALEKGERPSPERLIARGRVGHAAPRRDGRYVAEEDHADAAEERRDVAQPLLEARPDADVRVPARDPVGERGDVGRIVLPVAVELDEQVVAGPDRVLVARLERDAVAHVERVAHDRRAVRARDLGRLVRRAVVDDDDVEAGGLGLDLVDHGAVVHGAEPPDRRATGVRTG